jgi:sigma-B regulation protein RsbU (phosphoserine phosphatase)
MPPMPERASRSLWLAYVVLAVLFGISLIHRTRDTVDRVDEIRNGSRIARLPFSVDLPGFVIIDPHPEAAAAGIGAGDRIVGVEGTPPRDTGDLFVPLRHRRAGDYLTLQIQPVSDAPAKTASIRLEPIREGPPRTNDWLYFAVVSIGMPYLCLALGFWVAAVRIRDPQAWLLLALLLSLAEFVSGDSRTIFGREDAFQSIALTYQQLLGTLWPLAMLLFAMYFPERIQFDRRFPWAKWIVIVPIFVTIAASTVSVNMLARGNLEAATATDRILRPALAVVSLLQLIAVIGFFAAMGYQTVHASSPDARRRLLLLDAGAAVSIAPIVVAIVLQSLDVIAFSGWWILLLGIVFVFPLTMAYVIVVERAMDVRVVLRQGLQYLLARGTLRAIQIVLSVSIVAAVATMGASATPLNRILLISIALAIVLLIGSYAERLHHWVDRRFFREAYNAEQVLTDLARDVRTMVQTGPLLETVAHRVSDTLHVPRVAILLNSGGMLEPAYALNHPALTALALPQGALTSDGERALRNALESELLLRLSSNQKLLGVMSLGPKQSDEPFSGSDMRLLDAVATQTGLALENSRLTAEIAAEVATREKARRELEIAHEVQERLFPQQYPPVAGLDYAGACRPASGIGGDYYDFIHVSDTKLGIAIGDVSGKGIPAALLMATLRAYLRGQTSRGGSDLASMMSTLNTLVYESSAANRYATFFFGQYDAATRVLDYVNCGHNPPMVFRRAGTVVRLDTGGPVIGLIEQACYSQDSIALEAGDVLVAFTDGISEAMNARDEEWGEERLAAAVLPARTQPAGRLIERVMQEADTFVGGARQYDDMTVVIVRLTTGTEP